MTREKSVMSSAQQYALKSFEIVMYVAGVLTRIQTIVVGIFLFKVETNNVCVVEYNSL